MTSILKAFFDKSRVKKQIDYFGANMSNDSLGSFVDDYNTDYFTLQPDSNKFSHLRLDEPRSDGDGTLPLQPLYWKLQLL